jgi:hypothetical protein
MSPLTGWARTRCCSALAGEAAELEAARSRLVGSVRFGPAARAYVAGEFCAVRSSTSCDRRVDGAFGTYGPMGGDQVGRVTWFGS